MVIISDSVCDGADGLTVLLLMKVTTLCMEVLIVKLTVIGKSFREKGKLHPIWLNVLGRKLTWQNLHSARSLLCSFVHLEGMLCDTVIFELLLFLVEIYRSQNNVLELKAGVPYCYLSFLTEWISNFNLLRVRFHSTWQVWKESILSQSKALNFQNFPGRHAPWPPSKGLKEFSGPHRGSKNVLGSYPVVNGKEFCYVPAFAILMKCFLYTGP